MNFLSGKNYGIKFFSLVVSAIMVLILALAVNSAENKSGVSSIKKSSDNSIWKRIIPTKKNKYQNLPTTVAGVRGLDEEPEGRGDNNSRDWEALKKVDSLSEISDIELEGFVKEGGLK